MLEGRDVLGLALLSMSVCLHSQPYMAEGY